MIAYDRMLEFSPDLEISDTHRGTRPDRITLKRAANEKELRDLAYETVFHQNQGRQVQLRSDFPIGTQKHGQHWVFCVQDVVSFFWRSGENVINCFQHALWTPELCRYWLLHTLLPFYFTIEKTYYIFHAGAVEIDNKPVLFTAESFGGKSTLTDFFLRQGHPLVSDDKVATYELDGKIFVTPSYAYHRPYRKTEDLGYAARNFAESPKPIHAIYELEPAKAEADILISELQGIDKFKSLRYSSEINLFFLNNKRFAFLAQMANQVPVFNISVPRKIQRLPEVYDAIRNHFP